MAFNHIEDAARAALAEYGVLPPKHFKYDTFQVLDVEDGKKRRDRTKLENRR